MLQLGSLTDHEIMDCLELIVDVAIVRLEYIGLDGANKDSKQGGEYCIMYLFVKINKIIYNTKITF